MTRTIDLAVKADLKALRRELATLPPEFRKSAQMAVNELQRQLKRADRVAEQTGKKLGDEMKKGATQAKEGVDGVKTALEALGLAGAPAADGLQKGIDAAIKLGGAGGAVGLAIGVSTAAVLAFGAAGVTAALQAGALIKELDDLGRAEGITQEQRDRVGAMDLAIREATIATKEITIAFGAEFAPVLTEVASGLVSVIDQSKGLISTWGELREQTEGVRRVVAAVTSLGLSEAMGLYSEGLGDAAEAAYQAEQAVRSMAKTVDEAVKMEQGWAAEEQAIRDAQAEGHRAAAAAREAAAARAAAAAAAVAEAERQAWAETAAVIRADMAVREAAEVEQAGIDKARKAALDADTAREAKAVEASRALAKQRQADAVAAAQAVREAWLSAGQTVADLFGQVGQSIGALTSVIMERSAAAADQFRAEMGERRDLEEQRIRRMVRTGEISEEEAKAERERLRDARQAERKAERERQAAVRRAAMAAFIVQKTAAASQIVVSTLVAATRALELGPIAGPIAAGVISAAGAANAAAVAAERPRFHRGGMAGDEFDARLRRNEAVITPQGVQAIGGPQAVAALNRGQPAAGQPIALNVSITMPDGTTQTATATGSTGGGTIYAATRTAPGRRIIGR